MNFSEGKLDAAFLAEVQPHTYIHTYIHTYKPILSHPIPSLLSMCLSCQVYNKEEQLKSSIVFAREYLKETKISRDQLKYLCEEASRGGALTHHPNLTTLT